MSDLAAPTPPADVLRFQLADELLAGGAVTTSEVERAVRTVPREAFVPEGTSLVQAYANDVVITQRDGDGKVTSSVSAPWLQVYMLEAAQLRPGAEHQWERRVPDRDVTPLPPLGDPPPPRPTPEINHRKQDPSPPRRPGIPQRSRGPEVERESL